MTKVGAERVFDNDLRQVIWTFSAIRKSLISWTMCAYGKARVVRFGLQKMRPQHARAIFFHDEHFCFEFKPAVSQTHIYSTIFFPWPGIESISNGPFISLFSSSFRKRKLPSLKVGRYQWILRKRWKKAKIGRSFCVSSCLYKKKNRGYVICPKLCNMK